VNDYSAQLVADQPDRFGFFATVPMPHVDESITESVRALDELTADGVVLLANNAGTYVGQEGQDALWDALNDRSAVVFIHPAELPGPTVPGVLPWATDFLLDTTRAAYLLVRNGIRRKYPNIKFILSHAGGFVPYSSYRMATAITSDTGRSPADALDDFASFYFDTALSSSTASLPTLLAFAKTRSHHIRIRLALRARSRGKALCRRRTPACARDSLTARQARSSSSCRHLRGKSGGVPVIECRACGDGREANARAAATYKGSDSCPVRVKA
jgi:predicted TIM-barrel fold metal-dependent hydrolase